MNPGHMEYCASDDWRQLVHETILPVALTGVTLGDAALEIGPGPGFTTDILRTKTAHLTAVELDAGLAAGLAERMSGTNVSVCVGDATALDFEDASFTGAASFHMLHHIAPAEAQDRVFAELSRVLVPGATLVAADGVYSEGSAAFHQDDTYNCIAPEELEPRLRAAGFGSVRVRTYDLGWVCTARLT